jgi:pantothenate kinase
MTASGDRRRVDSARLGFAEGVNDDRIEALVRMAAALATPGRRRLLGITGAPGSGKSSLGELLAAALSDRAALVSLDGFHLANTELHRLGLHNLKGSPETFDAAGFVNLLQRLRAIQDEVVYAPVFDRALEESLAAAMPVSRDIPLILVEGNYLLLDGPIWGKIRPLLDECWYVDPGEDTRLQRLVTRHETFGRTREEALERSLGSDQRNAELVAANRHHASRVVHVPVLDTSDSGASEGTGDD